MQIGPTQTIPWHYHTEAQDTFLRHQRNDTCFYARAEEEVCLTVGQTYSVRPDVLTLSLMPVTPQPYFLVLQGMGEHDFVPLT